MADFTNIIINDVQYDVLDSTARQEAASANSKAETATETATEALEKANSGFAAEYVQTTKSIKLTKIGG